MTASCGHPVPPAADGAKPCRPATPVAPPDGSPYELMPAWLTNCWAADTGTAARHLPVQKLMGPTRGETDDWQRALYKKQAWVSRFFGRSECCAAARTAAADHPAADFACAPWSSPFPLRDRAGRLAPLSFPALCSGQQRLNPWLASSGLGGPSRSCK